MSGGKIWGDGRVSHCTDVLKSSLRYDVAKSAHEQTAEFDVPLFFRVKSPSWEYEEEYRQFINLKTCSAKGGRYFTPANPGRFKGVILGLRCAQAPEYFHNIFKNKMLTDAKVWKTEKHPDKFLLQMCEC